MRKSSVRTSLIVILIALSTIITLQNPVKAQGEPNVYVTNPLNGTGNFIFYTNTTAVGFKFNATVYVSNGTTVFGWQMRMNYNSTFLNATRAWIVPASDPDYILDGQASLRPPPALTLGSVLVGDTSLAASVNFTTPKKAAIVELQVMASPPPGAGSKLSSVLNITNADTYLLNDLLNEITITKTNGLYEFNYSPPATQISIGTTAATVTYGGRINISGTIATVPPDASKIFAGITVSIMHHVGTSGDFTVINLATTNSTSGYLFTWIASGVVAGLHQFQASWSGNATYSGAVSSIISVTVTIPAGSPTISVNNAQTGTSNFIFYTNTTAVGFKFNATVNVNNGTDVASWQVILKYNATYLNATRAWIPSTDAQYIFVGLGTFPLSPVFTAGSVQIGDLTVPAQGVTFTTSKKLAIIEFEIMAAPPTGVGNKLSSTLDISTPDTFIYNNADPIIFEIPTVRTNGLYELRSGSKPSSLITISANPATVIGGASVTINGTITTAANARVTIWHKIGTGAFTNLTTVITNSASIYTYSWTSAAAGPHQFKANWTGNEDYLGAESTTVSVTVNKASSTINLIANPTSVAAGATVTLSGTISPTRVNVNVTITSGTTPLATVKTATDGTYSYAWTPTAEGTYNITASWSGDDTYNGASDSAIVTVTPAPPTTDYTIYYIIAAVVIIVVILILLYWYMRRRRQQQQK